MVCIPCQNGFICPLSTHFSKTFSGQFLPFVNYQTYTPDGLGKASAAPFSANKL
jgi:hypothetical protein